MIGEVDKDGTGKISFTDFLVVMTQKMANIHPHCLHLQQCFLSIYDFFCGFKGMLAGLRFYSYIHCFPFSQILFFIVESPAE